jgi:hypothetical protein
LLVFSLILFDTRVFFSFHFDRKFLFIFAGCWESTDIVACKLLVCDTFEAVLSIPSHHFAGKLHRIGVRTS